MGGWMGEVGGEWRVGWVELGVKFEVVERL